MEGQHRRIQKRSEVNAGARRQPQNRSICANPRGRWADNFAGGAPGSGSQFVSPWAIGNAAQEHRNLTGFTAETQRVAERTFSCSGGTRVRMGKKNRLPRF